MNRIVLIGNGFDRAHNLNTSYEHFINWYWEQKAHLYLYYPYKINDILFTLQERSSRDASNLYNHFRSKNEITIDEFKQYILNNNSAYTAIFTEFFKHIIEGVKTNGWVDIENEYYQLLKYYSANRKDSEAHHLNEELKYLQDLLIEYLKKISSKEPDIIKGIKDAIYEPISQDDIAVEAKTKWEEWIAYWTYKEEIEWRRRAYDFGIEDNKAYSYVNYAHDYKISPQNYNDIPTLFRLPEGIMLLSFNYTPTIKMYLQKDKQAFSINNIHGQLEQPESIIFGHGDEMDEQFKQIQNLNDQEYLKNIKSINYMKSDNYRKVLSFIESAPFQIYIMGHSCGNSDRTLLNTLFEHDNCVSIKPFYYIKENGTDNYLELVQNISRNFKSMKLMRDRVVNKEYCKPLDNEQQNNIDTSNQNS